MAVKEAIKPITYMKTNAADILAEVSETQRPMIITHNGEGKMVIQDIESYEATRASLALLKIAALGREAVRKGKTRPAREALAALEARTKRRRGAKKV